jgi:hypothetical protein
MLYAVVTVKLPITHERIDLGMSTEEYTANEKEKIIYTDY